MKRRKPYGSRLAQILVALKRTGGVTCMELAKEIGSHRGDLSNQFARLAKKGLCVHVRTPSVSGVRVRYFATQALADNWARDVLPGIQAVAAQEKEARDREALRRARMRERQRRRGLGDAQMACVTFREMEASVASIVEGSGAVGVLRRDIGTDAMARAASRMARRGRLFYLRDGNCARYFGSPELMDEWRRNRADALQLQAQIKAQMKVKAPKPPAVKVPKYGATKPVKEKASSPAAVTLKFSGKLQGDAIVPPNVKYTKCPSVSWDPRYQLPPNAKVPRVFKLECEPA